MFSSFGGSFKFGRGRPLVSLPPGVPALQILLNDEFDVDQNTQTAWVSTVGWGGNDKPALGGGILIFTFTDRTVTQTVSITDYETYNTGTLDFAVARDVNKTDARSTYNILVRFLDSGSNLIGSYRYPETGEAQTNGTSFQAISESFSLPIGAVSTIEVAVTARESPGGWAGQYGPRFDYVRFTLS